MPTLRASSYITLSPTTVGSTVTLPFPTGTAINDLVIIATVNNGIGAYAPAGWGTVSYTDIVGLSWAVYEKTMDILDIAAGSVSVSLGFPPPAQVWAVVATNGPASILEGPYSSSYTGSGSESVSTSGSVTSSDLAVLFAGVVGSTTPAVSPGSNIGTGTGTISGILAQDGSLSNGVNTFSFTSLGGFANFAIAIILSVSSPVLSITCDSPPGAVLGSAYNHIFPASGGTTPYTFAITSGSLPTGLTLNASTGSVTGTPTSVGYYPFQIRVTDAVPNTASVNCSITVAPGGAWIIQEITAELIPNNSHLPGAGHYRYTVRCVNAAQAGTYLGFWSALGGGGGSITSIATAGGGELSPVPSQPSITTEAVAKNGTLVGSEPEINFIEGTNVTLTVTDDTTNKKVDVTISSTAAAIGGVLLKAADYTINPTTDAGNLVVMNSASPHTITLPASPPASPWLIAFENIGAGILTIARNGNTIDAAASDLTLNQNQGVFIFSNGSAYYTERGMGTTGAITSLTLVEPAEFTVTGSPTSGSTPTITVGKATQTAGTAWMGPVSGSAAQPTFRAIQATDLPPVALVLTLNKYVQNFSAVTSVTINHNFGSTAVVCQVYNSSGVQMYAETQTIVDANNISLTFGAAFTGSAVVLGTTARNANTIYTTSWTSQTSVTVTHNLGTLQVIVQVFDAAGLLVLPETTTLTSSNVVTLTFAVAFTGSCTVMASPLAVAAIGSYSTSWTAQTSVTVTHNLNTSNVVVQVADGSGLEIEAESVTCTSANVVTLTFGASTTGSVVVIG